MGGLLDCCQIVELRDCKNPTIHNLHSANNLTIHQSTNLPILYFIRPYLSSKRTTSSSSGVETSKMSLSSMAVIR